MTDSNTALVAHLFRRAGFGLRGSEENRFPLDDYAATVEALISPTIAKRDDQSSIAVSASDDELPLVDAALRDAQNTWMQAMVTSRAPLVERMVLFLSNHFATAFSPSIYIDATALVRQQATIRNHALGSFAQLTHAMVDDLALAVYLNNDRNREQRPNENLGRELMELFTLGVGAFTERDVKEVARALTGYQLQRIPGARPRLIYDKTRHDDGFKTVLGVTAKFTPHGVVDLLLAQSAAKRFIATKLITTFVGPTPDAALVGTVAKALDSWDLRAAMGTIFHSSHFRATAARQSLAKSPAEYMVGMLRGLRRSEYIRAVDYMAAAGQELYRPPSVAGWPSGRRMLGAGAMLARYNAASYFASLHVRGPAMGTPKGANVQEWMKELGIVSLSATTVDALATYRREAGTQTTAGRTAGVLTVLLSSSDFQLA